METFINFLEDYNINSKSLKFVLENEKALEHKFKEIEQTSLYNTVKVLKAMQKFKLSSVDFAWNTGYGYSDVGREKTESIYSEIFKTEDAIVRPNIVSGTHAISLCLFSQLKKGDHLLSLTAAPYDTLQKVIGIKGSEEDSLINNGIEYSDIKLKFGCIDYDKIAQSIKKNTKMVLIQRSTGYSDRRAFTVSEIKKAVDIVREINDDIIIFVDNCYGEFTEKCEPSEFCDLVAGSLIKNPGGGLAYSGGYVVGKKKLVNRVASRLTAPGIAKDCGLTFGMTRNTLQGLFIAPRVVADALKSVSLYSSCFEALNYHVVPSLSQERSDIVLAIELRTKELLEKFVKSIQASSPVDSIYIPTAWDMPGYEDKVVMASGGFIEGSSIELSADGPMREPYYVYLQGALTYEHAKYALINLIDDLELI